MTLLATVQAMFNEQLRMEIAEMCGFTPCPLFQTKAWSKEPTGLVEPFVFQLPNYPEDLNAMAEAWEWLRKGEGLSLLEAEGRRSHYGEHLWDFAEVQVKSTGGSMSYVLANLKCRQRAEAFWLTMKEGK